MIIKSEERSTGMGAHHSAALLTGNKFVEVSKLQSAEYHGRGNGFQNYSIEVSDDSIWAQFDRSNSGKESVRVYRGTGKTPIKEFASFDDADRYAASR